MQLNCIEKRKQIVIQNSWTDKVSIIIRHRYCNRLRSKSNYNIIYLLLSGLNNQ